MVEPPVRDARPEECCRKEIQDEMRGKDLSWVVDGVEGTLDGERNEDERPNRGERGRNDDLSAGRAMSLEEDDSGHEHEGTDHEVPWEPCRGELTRNEREDSDKAEREYERTQRDDHGDSRIERWTVDSSGH